MPTLTYASLALMNAPQIFEMHGFPQATLQSLHLRAIAVLGQTSFQDPCPLGLQICATAVDSTVIQARWQSFTSAKLLELMKSVVTHDKESFGTGRSETGALIPFYLKTPSNSFLSKTNFDFQVLTLSNFSLQRVFRITPHTKICLSLVVMYCNYDAHYSMYL